ncbi:hypothetical protein ACFPYI_01910 [Halomarina salina]|uniref:Uncharacterized protein n=1 Tax=Halomarina salina TaxID=1872699 RepID=A0ABD5RHL0_9EURY|nr:hypothetical protein [Halomarina salina]
MQADVNLTGVASLVGTLDALDARWTTEVTYVVGTNVEYAVHVEFGTSQMAAQPYLRPAAERTNRQLDQIAAQADSVEEFVRLAALEVEAISKDVVPVDTGNLQSSITAQRIS